MTAVEWLVEKHFGGIDNCTPDFRYHIKQAKEMERQHIIDCSIQTTQDCFISVMNSFGQNINFTEEDLKNQRLEAEQYYNETFNK
jgi:hypothetical protein